MAIRIGINGFGRIGRVVFRVGQEHPDLEFVAVNDLTNADTLAHLLKYDSTYGRFPADVESGEGKLIVGGKDVLVLEERDPAKLPWGDLGVDVVLESTGVFLDRGSLEKHIRAGASCVLLSVPSKTASDVDATIVVGVNDNTLNGNTRIVSNASCTTNCLAPLSKAVNDAIGIEQGLMTTIHSYTNDQRILDFPHDDLRRARSAADNIIPTSTGAAKAIGLVIPELDGRMNGVAVRVPTITGSLVDLVASLSKNASVDEVNDVVKSAAEGSMKGVLSYCTDPIVSSDVIGDPHSSVFDSLCTMKVGDRMVKLVSWYDNEWGYSSRCCDLFKKMASLA